MVQETVRQISAKANEALTETFHKPAQAFSLVSEVNRNLSGRTVDVSAAIVREGVEYLGHVQGTIRQASEEAQEFWNRQWAVPQDQGPAKNHLVAGHPPSESLL